MNQYSIIRPSIVCNRLRRPPRPLQPHGSRAVHLLHHLFGGSPNSLYDLAGIRKARYPPADKLSLRLLNGPGNESSTMTLSEALKNLQPCSYLMQSEMASEKRPGGYCIKKFKPPDLVKQSRKIGPLTTNYYKRDGRGKECHLTTDCTTSFLRHQLSLAYNFLLEGSRMEFHLRRRAKNKLNTVDWALSQRLDLRPESILAAMPPGTTMLALPGIQGPYPEGKQPKHRHITKLEEVFWALEYPPTLKSMNCYNTSKQIRELGTWSGKIRPPSRGDPIEFPGFRVIQRAPGASHELPPQPLQGDLADLLESPPNDDSDPDVSPDETSPREPAKKSNFRPFA